MVKRKSIGIIFSEAVRSWTGGLYYNLNLIQALNYLPDKQKPALIIFADDELYKVVEQTKYPYLKKCTDLKKFNTKPAYNQFERIINKVGYRLLKKKLIEKRLSINDINFLFPLQNSNLDFYRNKPFQNKYFFSLIPKVYWIPDFQEHYLPQFFSEEEIVLRKVAQKELAEQDIIIVFSSEDAKNDFYKFYPNAKAKPKLLNFAVSHPDYSSIDGNFLKAKYELDKPYFFSPNQFWAHKNHKVVIEAARLLKEKGNNSFIIAFSGKEDDYRNPEYFNSLKALVDNYQLEKHVKFLGFLDRREQLKLMNMAIALIQPSLFEGWSTVIEDAKSMNQFVIASNLKVHHEQLIHNALFFNPYNEYDLVEKLENVMNYPPEKVLIDYTNNIIKFAREFINLI